MTIKQVFNTSAELDFPTVLPTLDLDFANTKALDPRITFTRSTGGSYVGADGILKYAGVNEARFDHNPVTGESLGLLIEESRQNLWTDSEDFNNTTTWTKSLSTIQTNVSTAPDGNLTADKLIANSGVSLTGNDSNGGVTPVSGLNIVTTSAHTFSIFAKAAEISTIRIRETNQVGTRIIVDLNNGNISYEVGNSSQVAATTQKYPNGWWRIILTRTPTISLRYVIKPGTLVGDGSSGVLIWGSQMEPGAFPTSYIPTTTSSRTRAADNASITGTNFSSWYNQTEGSLYMSLFPNYSNATENQFKRFLSINVSPGTGQDNVIQLISLDSSNQIQSALWFNSVFQAGGNTPIRSGTEGKIAFSLRQNSSTFSGNGLINTVTFPNDTSCILPPNMNRMDIGGYGGIAGYQSNGCYKRITYYPKALPPSQLQALTS